MAQFNFNPLLGWADQHRNQLAGLGAGLLNGQPGAGVQAGLQADDAYATMQKAETERQQNLAKQQELRGRYWDLFTKMGATGYATAVMDPSKNPADVYFEWMKNKADGSSSNELWGLTPQAYEVPGPDGQSSIQIGVMSNKGNFKPVPLPENAQPVFPVQQLNTGTNFKGVDKFGRGTGGAIPIDNAGKSFAEGVGGGAAKSFQNYQDQAQSAYATLGQLGVMQNAMNDPNFYSGIGSDTVQNFKRVIVALGGDPSSVSSMETFGAAANKVVLDGIGGSLGAQISNSDRSFIERTAPNLGNTPEGNRQLIEIATKLANRKIEVAQLAADYVQKNGSLDTNWPAYLAQWAQANPLFGGAPAAPSAPVVDMGGGVTIQEIP